MKRFYLPAPVLVLAISAALIGSANQSLKARDNDASTGSDIIFASTAADRGRLLIKRSPTLGDNIAVAVTIDGKPAGSVRRGHAYERSLAPGRHVLLVSPNRLRGPWRATLDVRAGETYSYIASYHIDKLVLTPVTKSR